MGTHINLRTGQGQTHIDKLSVSLSTTTLNLKVFIKLKLRGFGLASKFKSPSRLCGAHGIFMKGDF